MTPTTPQLDRQSPAAGKKGESVCLTSLLRIFESFLETQIDQFGRHVRQNVPLRSSSRRARHSGRLSRVRPRGPKYQELQPSMFHHELE